MTMDHEFVRLEQEDGVLTITLDRQPVNAFNGQMHTELTEVLTGLAAQSDVRVVILTGSGQCFSAGGDLSWMDELNSTDAYALVLQETMQMLTGILDAPQPVIAKVGGPAVGLGASLALCCDMVIAAESARFSDPHVQVGLVAGDGGAALWPLLVGPARAKEYLLTGAALGAAEAERIGLVNRTVPDAELDAAVHKLAGQLKRAAPLAVRWTKQAVNQGMKALALQVLTTSMGLEGITFRSADCQEAIKAFKERRKPEFRGC